MTVALGVLTRDRPEFFARCIESIHEHLGSTVEWIFVYDDGSISQTDTVPICAVLDMGIRVERGAHPRGVAHGKNWLLTMMLSRTPCDWTVICEDDLVITDPMVVANYVAACEESGFDHLSFHAHGPLNPAPIGMDDTGAVTYWPNSVGAWAIFSRQAILQAGQYDEGFHNAMEHVELTQRMAERGYTTKWPRNADATGSEAWLAEQPGAIESSVIRADPNWAANVEAAKRYWQRAHPESFRRVFGQGV